MQAPPAVSALSQQADWLPLAGIAQASQRLLLHRLGNAAIYHTSAAGAGSAAAGASAGSPSSTANCDASLSSTCNIGGTGDMVLLCFVYDCAAALYCVTAVAPA